MLGQETRTKGEGPAGDQFPCAGAETSNEPELLIYSKTWRWLQRHPRLDTSGVKSQGTALDRRPEGDASGTLSHWCDIS